MNKERRKPIAGVLRESEVVDGDEIAPMVSALRPTESE
jgi:hypothetical protein